MTASVVSVINRLLNRKEHRHQPKTPCTPEQPCFVSEAEWAADRRREESEQRVMSNRIQALHDRVLLMEQDQEEELIREVDHDLERARANIQRAELNRARTKRL